MLNMSGLEAVDRLTNLANVNVLDSTTHQYNGELLDGVCATWAFSKAGRGQDDARWSVPDRLGRRE